MDSQPTQPSQSPTGAVPPVGSKMWIWLGTIVFLMFAGAVLLVDLALTGLMVGPAGLIVGLVFAIIPVPLYVGAVLWLDRYEAEPLWMLTTAFLWGATFAALLAGILNSVFGAVFGGVVSAVTGDPQAGAAAGNRFLVSISAPFVEESLKAIILLVLFWWKRDEFDNVLDGVIYASMVGLGFAMTENILYYGRGLAQGGVGTLTVTLVIRGFFSPFAHPLFTSMTGIGLGWSRQTDNRFVNLVAPIAGLGLAMFWHFLWNTVQGGWWFLLYLVVMVPLFLIVLTVVVFALMREGRIVRQYLQGEWQSGLLSDQEYQSLTTVRGRWGARLNALFQGGLGRYAAVGRYHHAASVLAFHRQRAARGLIEPAAASAAETRYLGELTTLRVQLGYAS